MYQKEVFHIDYPTGQMNINVCNFFGTANQDEIKKVLRLARQNCPDSRRFDLIAMLLHEQEQLKDILDKIDVLEKKRQELLAPIYSGLIEYPDTAAEKMLRQMCEKLSWAVEFLSNVKEKERWRG